MRSFTRLDGLVILDTELTDAFYRFCEAHKIYFDFHVSFADSVSEAMALAAVGDLTSEDALDYATEEYDDK
jgi:hypothetical protein